MLRLLGGILIVSGSLGMGLWYRERFVGRLAALRNLQSILEMLMSEIRYSRATLPECCIHIAKRVQEPYSSCFVHIHAEMEKNTGIGFGQIFREQMEECMKGLPLLAEDRSCILSLFADGGFEEERMQIRSIEQQKELLMHTISRLEKENREKCRMAVGLGAMSGLLLVILLF